MPYPDIWGVNKGTFLLDEREDVKSEFQAPCRAKYNDALNAILFLCQFHDCNAIFEALRKDVRR